MNTHTPRTLIRLLPALALLASACGAAAGAFFADFNDGLVPANATVYGSAAVSGSGGVTNSGCLQLTTASASQTGAFVITSDLDGGTPVVGFTASFKAFVGSPGIGADGFSFNFSTNLPTGPFGEEGAGSGNSLTIEFDTFVNSPEIGATLDVKIGGLEVGVGPAGNLFPGLRMDQYVDVVVQLNPDNTLDVIYDGIYAYSNLNLSAFGYVPAAGSLFGLGARTGGTTDNHFIDNLSIVTRTNAGAFVESFAPRGRRVQQNSSLDIVLTNFTTQVNSGSIVLQLDGTAVTPLIGTAGGITTLHFQPGNSFAPYTTHRVSLTFADNASPSPQTTTLQYGFSVVGNYLVRFSEDFESYNRGSLDQNDPTGQNQSPNGGPGNPWFGPLPPNSRIVGTEGSVSPHSGTNMTRGLGGIVADFDQDYLNLAYRLHGGAVFNGNILLDWWFYDPLGPGGTGFRDYVALVDYLSYQTTTDQDGSGNPGSGINQRLSLGATFFSGNGTFDANKYQARVAGATSDPGITNTSGWFNTTATRSIGWHHGRIIVGPQLTTAAPLVEFYIDDMVNPTVVHNAITSTGYNFIEINSQFGTQTGYFDDFSFAVAVPPNLTVTRSGSNAILTWPGPGFTLQSATDITGPWTDITGAISGYTYDMTSNPQQFFRLRN